MASGFKDLGSGFGVGVFPEGERERETERQRERETDRERERDGSGCVSVWLQLFQAYFLSSFVSVCGPRFLM